MKRKILTAKIDRPIGFQDSFGNVYPINYGYIPDILGGDGEPQDIYVISKQVNEPLVNFTGELVAIVHRADDTETKWVLTEPGEELSLEMIVSQIYFLEQYFNSTIEIL